MNHCSKEEFVDSLFRSLGNREPHPYMRKWVGAWIDFETANPMQGALHNPLNTKEPGFGSDLMPRFNPDGVRMYPTFEDGVAATAHSLIGGTVHYYPVLLEALQNNHGEVLQNPTQELANELDTWGTGHALEIANKANTGNVNMLEPFPCRHWGQQ